MGRYVMTERDALGIPALGLRQYLLLVANALDSPAWYCEVAAPAHAYLVLEGGVPRYPDQAMALLWSERDGWAAAVESPSGDDELILAYLGQDVLPSTEAVLAFVRQFYVDGYPGRPDPPDFRSPGADDGFEDRLAAWARTDGSLPGAPAANPAGPVA